MQLSSNSPLHALGCALAALLANNALAAATNADTTTALPTLSAQEAQQIAREATIYGFPMVDNYRIMYSYFVDKHNPEYKGPWNTVHNTSRVFTPEDKAIQTPNSDTPYSQLGADLRAEPLVISVPKVAADRYYSLQFIDLYTHNFAYVGTRATGTEAGNYLLVGPNWQGETPANIKQVIRSETELAFVLYRTELKGADDLHNVKKIQANYRIQPLSSFTKGKPTRTETIHFPKAPSSEAIRTSAEFFNTLNFLLQFAPPHPTEIVLREKFARIGIKANHAFNLESFSEEIQQAIRAGQQQAWQDLAKFKAEQVDTGKRTAADGFGSREFLNNDYLGRMSSAAFGIYGNSKEEAIYPAYFTDAQGKPLDGQHQYQLHFAKDELPPVNAFWSLTMYKLPESLLSENSINRYLINSYMLDSLVRDQDGGITIYIQHDKPKEALAANWLPAPKGPFWVALRMYWPKPEALDGSWQAPKLQRIDK